MEADPTWAQAVIARVIEELREQLPGWEFDVVICGRRPADMRKRPGETVEYESLGITHTDERGERIAGPKDGP